MATLKEYIMSELCKRGLQEAASVEVKLKSGETIMVHSDYHPALNRDASEAESVSPRQTAEGGK